MELSSRTGRFAPVVDSPGTHWTGDLLGPRAGLNAVVKTKIPHLPGITPRSPSS